jgi:hypothetical protein
MHPTQIGTRKSVRGQRLSFKSELLIITNYQEQTLIFLRHTSQGTAISLERIASMQFVSSNQLTSNLRKHGPQVIPQSQYLQSNDQKEFLDEADEKT